MKMNNLCRFCGNITIQLISNEDLISKLEKSLPVQLCNENDYHRKMCTSCEQKLYMVSEFYEAIIETTEKFRVIAIRAQEEADKRRLSVENEINLSKAKIAKLPNLRIQKILTSTEQAKENEMSKPNDISQQQSIFTTESKSADVLNLIEKLSNRCLTVIRVSHAPKSGATQSSELIECDELLESSTINHATEIETDITNDTVGLPNDVDDDELDDGEIHLDDTFDFEDEEYTPSSSFVKKEKPEKKKQSVKSRKSTKKIMIVNMENPASYVCIACKERFGSFDVLKEHMANSERCKLIHLTCHICSKVCDSKRAIYQHLITHRKHKNYVCDECGKSYTNRFNLENHKSSQHGEHVEEFGSIYKCRICDVQYTNRKELYDHINIHSNEPANLLCDTCGKIFTSPDTLKSHARVHLDIRPFPCDSCDKRFRSRYQLQQHAHVHTGVKNYSCESCGKTFAKHTSLIAHRRVHTGAMPYECNVCMEKFTSPNRLKTHHTKAHVEIETV